MLDINIIDNEILELEKRDTTYAVVERLAWLYIVRDHTKAAMTPVAQVEEEPMTTRSVEGTEFLEVSSGVDYAELMNILSDHMEAIRVVCPKEYESVMDKIRSLH